MGDLEGQSLVGTADLFCAHQAVADLIYHPAKTRFLELAESQGCQILNGLGMLLYQGALAFELWTGQEMPIEEVSQALNLK
jgi:shikimate dehydrogenase